MSKSSIHTGGLHLLLARFKENLKKKELWKQKDLLFVACSGGVDSVVLAHLLREAGFEFEILHCNFNLRGDESARDEDFVRAFAARMEVAFSVVHFDTRTMMSKWGMGVQEAARKLRYDWFRKIISDAALVGNKAHVLTAHHADDLAETMLIHFLRGTGISGLHGIPEKNDCFVRPLLFAGKQDILAYASEKELQWVEDSSNAEFHYTRNLIRNRIIPELETVFPSVKHNLIENARRFSEVEMLYNKQIEKIKSRLIRDEKGKLSIPVNLLRHLVPLDTLLFEIFGKYGFSVAQTEEIKKLFDAPTGKWISSASHRVLKNRNWLLIDALEHPASGVYLIEKEETEKEAEGFLLQLHPISMPVTASTDPMQACLDAKEIVFPLVLRKWKSGDYFYPLGMMKKKKVARFLTDLKLSRFEKENQWVLLSGSKIIWVAGRRIDERFKIRPGTSAALQLSISPISG